MHQANLSKNKLFPEYFDANRHAIDCHRYVEIKLVGHRVLIQYRYHKIIKSVEHRQKIQNMHSEY